MSYLYSEVYQPEHRKKMEFYCISKFIYNLLGMNLRCFLNDHFFFSCMQNPIAQMASPFSD